MSATGDFAAGARSGQQLFASLTAAYEYPNQGLLVSPYGRIELSRSWLDSFTEKGGGFFALRYGDQNVDTLAGVLGLRAQYAFRLDWGTLKPGVRLEYTHDFAEASRARMGYADLDGLPYAFGMEPDGRSHATLGLSLDAELPHDWSLGLDYHTTFGSAQRNHAFALQVGKSF